MNKLDNLKYFQSPNHRNKYIKNQSARIAFSFNLISDSLDGRIKKEIFSSGDLHSLRYKDTMLYMLQFFGKNLSPHKSEFLVAIKAAEGVRVLH